MPSSQLVIIRRRWLSSDYAQLFRLWKGYEQPHVVHVEKDGVENGEIVSRSGVVGSVLGHDFKGRTIEPHPKSVRWRQSFLRVGAFKRRSERLEVRKREFGAEELMKISEGWDVNESRQMVSNDETEDVLGFDTNEMNIFLKYVDDRLASMDTSEMKPTGAPNAPPNSKAPGKRSSVADDPVSRQLPIEFRSMPFSMNHPHSQKRRWRMKTWTSTGKRRRYMPQSMAYWRQEWEHIWPRMYRSRPVPSSPRRFLMRPTYPSIPRRCLHYIEDTVAPNEMQIESITGSEKKHHLTASVIAFLKTQPSFTGPVIEKEGRKNTIWPRRRHGAELHAFLQNLSNAIRDDHFTFHWEHQRYFEGRLYSWPSRKRKRKRTVIHHRADSHIQIFGNQRPITERFRSVLRGARFRMRTHEEIDSDE